MKKWLLVLSLILGCFPIYGSWHASYERPSEGELFMFVLRHSGATSIDRRQLLIVSRYRRNKDFEKLVPQGWWKVEENSLSKWCKEGSMLLYIPNLEDGPELEKLFYLLQIPPSNTP